MVITLHLRNPHRKELNCPIPVMTQNIFTDWRFVHCLVFVVTQITELFVAQDPCAFKESVRHDGVDGAKKV
jgi:hypothetical protein